jgi:hypothetical protein
VDIKPLLKPVNPFKQELLRARAWLGHDEAYHLDVKATSTFLKQRNKQPSRLRKKLNKVGSKKHQSMDSTYLDNTLVDTGSPYERLRHLQTLYSNLQSYNSRTNLHEAQAQPYRDSRASVLPAALLSETQIVSRMHQLPQFNHLDPSRFNHVLDNMVSDLARIQEESAHASGSQMSSIF